MHEALHDVFVSRALAGAILGSLMYLRSGLTITILSQKPFRIRVSVDGLERDYELTTSSVDTSEPML